MGGGGVVVGIEGQRGQRGAAGGSEGQRGAARGSEGQRGAARGSEGQRGATRAVLGWRSSPSYHRKQSVCDPHSQVQNFANQR